MATSFPIALHASPISRWARRPEQRLWVLAAAMVSIAVLLLATVGRLPAADGRPAMWVWPIAFAATEMCLVRIHFRHDAHTFSLSDLTLVAGLFLAAPAPLTASRVAGTVAVLIVVRRQPVRKVAFNGALVALSTAVAFTVLHVLGDPLRADTPVACVAALGAALAGETVALLAVHAALYVLNGSFPVRTLPRAFVFGAAGTLVNGSAGLLVALTMPDHPWAPLLVVAPAVTVLAIYHQYTTERRAHQRADFLYESASSLQRPGDGGDPLADLLLRVRSLLAARTVELLVVGGGGDADEMMVTAGASGAEACDRIPADRQRVILAIDGLATEPVLVDRRRHPDLAALLPGPIPDQAIIVPLAIDRDIRGALVVTTERGSTTRRLDGGDLRLMGALASHIIAFVETTQLGRRLEHQAYHDVLTQLANRSLLSRRIAEILERRGDAGLDVALLFVDLDDFKLVNDSFGHAVGDRLLQVVADRLLAVVPDDGVVARLGGDEFAVLLSDAGRAERTAVAVLDALSRPATLAGSSVVVHASVGIAVATDGDDNESLLRHADLAMYRAKERGKRRFDVYDDTLQEAVSQQQAIRSDLERAALRGQLVLHYQPIVDLKTGVAHGVEALLRWRHPGRGLLPPDKFIPMAEETGLIVPLGVWALRTAAAEVSSWGRRHPAAAALTVSVNVAARQLAQPDFADAALDALREQGLAPERLVIEITEGTLLGNRDLAVRHMERLREAGVRIAIDDFGTGYSSLGYLRTLPVDIVKIDKTFVRGLAVDTGDRALTLAIVRLLGTLDVETVAEGIETEEQLAYVTAMGCDSGQGFFFARPGDSETALAAVTRGPLGGAKVAIAG